MLNLDELVEEAFDHMAAEGHKDMAEDLDRTLVLDLFKDLTRIAVNSHHIRVQEYIEPIQERLRSYDRNKEEFITDFVDELYLKVRHEMPEQLTKEKSLYFVERREKILEVRLLVSEEAIALGLGIEPLIDLVV
jgi:hypothetical protein